MNEKINGIAGIYKSGRPMAQICDGTDITDTTVCRIASLTKSFTAAAFMSLIEKDELSVEMFLGEFIPGIPNGDRITIHNLLAQDSGIADFVMTEKFNEECCKIKTKEEVVDDIRELKPDFSPGEKWAYSNSNYILLGNILEKVSGMDYEDYLRSEFLDRLGMKNTGLDDGSRYIPNSVRGYTKKDAGLEEAQGIHMSQPFSTGGMYSCLRDLSIWTDALMNGKAVSTESFALMTGLHSYVKEDLYYGYGLHVRKRKTSRGIVREVSHAGEISGFISYLCIYPEKNTAFVVLSNVESDELEKTILELRKYTIKSFENS